MKHIAGSVVITIVFLMAVYLFLGERHTYIQNDKRITVLKTRLRLARRQQSEMAKKKRTLNQIRTFMDKAERLKLKTSNWTSYDVQLDDAYIFEDLKRILNQCANAYAYMFKPESLHIKIKERSEDDPSNSQQKKTNKSKGEIDKDSLMTLKGAFFAKRP